MIPLPIADEKLTDEELKHIAFFSAELLAHAALDAIMENNIERAKSYLYHVKPFEYLIDISLAARILVRLCKEASNDAEK